jgi:transcriptional regulator with XRE-family HTH domain
MIQMAALTEEEIHAYNEAVLARIRQLCARRGSSITKLEKALGYGNGTVSGWNKAKKKAPYDRIEAIAAYLGVPTVGLTGEERPAPPEGSRPGQAEVLRWVRSAGKEELLELISAAALRLKEL